MTAPTTGPRIKVLIAEDEEHLGTILEQFLLGRGYQVTVTRDGKAALAALRSEAYDVALLDIVMPEMDGLEVLRSIHDQATVETSFTTFAPGPPLASFPVAWEERTDCAHRLRLYVSEIDNEVSLIGKMC